MNLSFKQYVILSQPSEQLSEEQIDEIFGSFFGKSDSKEEKLKKLKAERERLMNQRGKTRAQIEKEWAIAKARAEGKPVPGHLPASMTIQPSGTTSSAAQARHAERQWSGNY
jgi:hypothetical protein